MAFFQNAQNKVSIPNTQKHIGPENSPDKLIFSKLHFWQYLDGGRFQVVDCCGQIPQSWCTCTLLEYPGKFFSGKFWAQQPLPFPQILFIFPIPATIYLLILNLIYIVLS